MGDLTKNFSLYEFYSRDGGTLPLCAKQNIQVLANELQALRNYLGVPIDIESGYRTQEHNQWLIDNGYPAAKNSQHLLGRAADIKAGDKPPEKVKAAVEYLIWRGLMREGGLGIYNTFIHYDIRVDSLGNPERARWDKRTR